MRRLLILSCSQRKRPDSELLPARDRYDGPAWRLVRRFLATHPTAPLCILACSARYGIIPANAEIADYNEKLDRTRVANATWLWNRVQMPLAAVLHEPFTAICVFGGTLYRQALDSVIWPVRTPVLITQGGIGIQLGQLKAWLYQTK